MSVVKLEEVVILTAEPYNRKYLIYDLPKGHEGYVLLPTDMDKMWRKKMQIAGVLQVYVQLFEKCHKWSKKYSKYISSNI